MPPGPVRSVRLPSRSHRTSRNAAATTAPGVNGSAAYREKMNLLTYNMALAQPDATVPLLAGSQKLSAVPLSQRLSSLAMSAATEAEGHSVQQVARRWVRDSDELCVASIRRSTNINKINTYVATYKFDDPQWKPFLLPEVHVLPSQPSQNSVDTPTTESDEKEATGSSSVGSAPPLPPSSTASTSSQPFEVYIDYNKMNTLEMISRHANYALRHLVQKGHAMYFVNYAQHSLLEMRGVVESSHITCAYGIRGERLRTHIVHIGPLDVRDVIEIDPSTRRVRFNLAKKGVRKGVVAISQVEGYGTWFQRKPMLWQRTRRIGALQSQLGAFGYELCPPDQVGRVRDYEVSLLAPHLRLFGSSGAEAVGIIASSQVAQNDRLYMGEFEAPVMAALDAVQQLAHASARHHKLVHTSAQPQPQPPTPTPAVAEAEKEGGTDRDEGTPAVVVNPDELTALRQRLALERLLPVSWVTRTPPPYVPLEGDLPFKLHMSKPSVFSTQAAPHASTPFPTGGTIGSPFVRGAPISLFEYNVHQGVDHYVFDDAPSARPMKWWSQKSNIPYNGYVYCMRSGLLDYVVPAERIPNPLASPTDRTGTSHRRSTAITQRLKRLRKRKLRKRADTAAPEPGAEPAHHHDAAEPVAEEDTHMDVSAELWDPHSRSAEELVGHDEASLREEAAVAAPAEQQEARVQYRAPVQHLVPPSPRAAARAARYVQYARLPSESHATQAASSTADTTTSTAAAAAHHRAPKSTTKGLNRVLRKQLRRLHAREAKEAKETPLRGSSGSADDSSS